MSATNSPLPPSMTQQAAARAAAIAPGVKIRVAIIGCGAVAQQFHLPVLAGHPGVELAALVDRNEALAGRMAAQYRVPRVLQDASALTREQVDAAVICTPPFHHAPCAVELAARGIHAFVEKPMTTSYAAACEMVAAAEAAGVVLSVGTFRRLLPSTRMLKALIESGWLGRPTSFDLIGGAVYGWHAATLGNMRKDWAGGGVLMDIGPHVLDQILYVLGDQVELLQYRDNALGGIETDCQADLRIDRTGHSVEGRVQLSRLRVLRNTLQIECERGRLEISTSERYRVSITPHDLSLTDALQDICRPFQMSAGWGDEPEMPWYEPFRVEIDDWLGAIRTGGTPQLSGRSALPVVKLIEDCYAQATRVPESWVQEGLPAERLLAASVAGDAYPPAKRKRVLVTGATGFVGCRVAEMLLFGEGYEVRALVHNPANAARLARLPVEMIQGDLQNAEDCRRMVADCDAVVHCGIGTAYGQRAEIFRVTVDGTRQLAAAAREAGVARFVHLSTMSVYGNQATGTLDETSPVKPVKGDDYSESKLAAEQAIADAAAQGLSAVTLRVATIYGPHAPLINVGPIKRLLAGQLALPRGALAAPSNTIYIDNVVAAIIRSLHAPAAVQGEVFNLSEGDQLTCGAFYQQFSAALDLELPIVEDLPAGENAARARGGLSGWASSWLSATREVAGSGEMRDLLRKALETDPLGRFPRGLIESSPKLKDWLRRRLKMDQPVIYERPEPPAAGPPLRIRPLAAELSVAKAQRVLGYAPVVSRERGIELTVAWMRHSQLIR